MACPSSSAKPAASLTPTYELLGVRVRPICCAAAFIHQYALEEGKGMNNNKRRPSGVTMTRQALRAAPPHR